MDADVFLSSKVLKLVGTSVTYDLGRGRTRESASTSTLCFFIERAQRDNCDAPVNLLSNTTIFITSVTINERRNHRHDGVRRR